MTVPAIGIDLGTTNSCISIYSDKPETILIDNQKTFPSIYNSTQNLVGHSAKQSLFKDPLNTFFATKRLIAKKFDDPELQSYLKSLPYTTHPHINGDIWVKGAKLISPIQIASKILEYAKKGAEKFINKKITDAVVTVPAYFDDHQRQATKTAAKLANINVLRIINEPTAAALAYGLDKEGLVAVYDLGGGTFDISILKIQNGIFQVLATNGNTFLGGEDLDFKIAEFIRNKQSGLSKPQLKHLSEQIKIKLSLFDEVKVIFTVNDSTSDSSQEINSAIDFNTKNKNLTNEILINYNKENSFVIKREEIENIVSDLVNKTILPCKQALKDAGLVNSDLTHVILVGGMTRMPLIRKIVQDIFKKVPILIDPDTAVSHGASIQAHSLKNDSKHLLLDINPLSLGIETLGGIFSPIIPRNTPLPSKKTQTFTTSEDNQQEVLINIYQGERPLVSHNKLLGTLKLNIPPKKKNVPKIEITFETDIDGLLKISARDVVTEKKVSSQLFLSCGYSDEELKDLLEQALANEQQDKDELRRIELINKISKLKEKEGMDDIFKEIEKPDFCVNKVENMLKELV